MLENKTLVLSSALFSPIAWFALMYNSNSTLIDFCETYPKQTYRNRYTISSANNKHDLNIPVIKTFGNNTKSKDILIIKNSNIIRKHLLALESAYNNSPYFEYFFCNIQEFFYKEHKNLIDMNIDSITTIEKILKCKFKYSLTNDFEKTYSNEDFIDLRFEISPKNRAFSNFLQPEYFQTYKHLNGFISNLSILDLVFNLGLESLCYLKKFPVNNIINSLKNEV